MNMFSGSVRLYDWEEEQRRLASMPTGTIALHGVNHEYGSIDQDVLWEMMYIKPKPVIIVCGYCNSHNAVTNPTCIQCGAPMGSGRERVYG